MSESQLGMSMSVLLLHLQDLPATAAYGCFASKSKPQEEEE